MRGKGKFTPSTVGFSRVAVTIAVLTALAASIGQPNPVVAGEVVNEGNDGRLTILLLASDSRGSGISRTDSIMVASINENKVISTASVPRDTARIPLPGGGEYRGKINGMVKWFRRTMSQDAALAKFELVMENLLQIEIDYRVVLWFGGLTTLVAEVDPITVNVTKELRDGKLIDDHAPDQPRGVYFPSASSYQLYATNESANGRPYCNGRWRFDAAPIEPENYCHRALPYTRSRKGSGNNDWVRQGRQQTFLSSAIKSVENGELDPLVTVATGQANGKWITNIPVNLTVATYLFNRFNGATHPTTERVVFKPKLYAARIPNTSKYQLKLPAVRNWAALHLK